MPEPMFGKTLARIIRKRSRALLGDASGAFKRGHDAELHELRIDVKRLRYTLELTIPIARDEALAALDLLALLQERLGDLADAATFGRTYAALTKALPANDPRHPGLETLRAQAIRERKRALETARALWRGAEAPYPERLAASISATLCSLSNGVA